MPAANTDVAGHIHPEGHADTPEARQYSRIRRWISVADATLGIVFLVVLLATGWTRDLRDVAFRFAHEHYVLALFYYVLFPIFYKFVPLEDQELRNRLVKLSERAGTRVRGVYEWKLSEKSKKANAALTGLGNTRRIILADTLLQNYSHNEIEAVLAHEL